MGKSRLFLRYATLEWLVTKTDRLANLTDAADELLFVLCGTFCYNGKSYIVFEVKSASPTTQCCWLAQLCPSDVEYPPQAKENLIPSSLTFKRSMSSRAANEHRTALLMVVRRVQGCSALAFAIFLVPHLLNTMMALLGPEVYQSAQLTFRAWYHSVVGEAVVLGSLAVHVVASLSIACHRWWFRPSVRESPSPVPSPSSQFPTYSRHALHRASGYVVLCFVFGHVYSCRFDGPPPEYEGLAHVLQHRTLRYLFLPYLVVFGAAGVVHTLLGLSGAVRLSGLPISTQLATSIRKSVFTSAPFIQVSVVVVVCGVLSIAGLVPSVY